MRRLRVLVSFPCAYSDVIYLRAPALAPSLFTESHALRGHEARLSLAGIWVIIRCMRNDCKKRLQKQRRDVLKGTTNEWGKNAISNTSQRKRTQMPG